MHEMPVLKHTLEHKLKKLNYLNSWLGGAGACFVMKILQQEQILLIWVNHAEAFTAQTLQSSVRC